MVLPSPIFFLWLMDVAGMYSVCSPIDSRGSSALTVLADVSEIITYINNPIIITESTH